MNFLEQLCKILGYNKLTYFRKFEHNIKYKEIDDETQIFTWKSPTNYGDKKP